jgi:signal transduction histidine kinase
VQGHGALLTLSMPVLNKFANASNHTLSGVSAIDVKLSELQRYIGTSTLGTDAYVFVVDNNGHILFHPKQILPVWIFV